MNVLITGGAGFIGSHLVDLHLQKGDEVYVVDNLITGTRANISSYLSNPLFHFTQKDVCVVDFYPFPVFDILYHLASPASPDKYKKYPVETMMANAFGTKRLLDLVKKNGKGIFVMASTSEVYGDPLEHPQKETYFGNVNTVGSRSCYDEAKRFAESLIMTYVTKFNIDARIARIFNTYGPNMEKNDGRVVSNFVVQALSNKPLMINGKGEQTRSFCYVSDLISGLYKLATTKKLKGAVVNLGNPEELTIKELAKIVITLTKSSSKIEYRSNDEDDPKKRKPDISKAKSLLKWNPTVSLKQGLPKTIEYFKERFI